MNAVTQHESNALALPERELIETLQGSLYPGAKDASVRLVIGYCKAANLDPIQKPVHIVPMRVKTGQKDQWGNDEKAMRDVVMPGIGLYRIQAARTGAYAGQDEPRWGDMLEFNYAKKTVRWETVEGRDKKQKREEWKDCSLRYPEWCSVTVYRLVGGMRVAFTATEYWIENYATAGGDSLAPNEMWERRTRGQLAKCAEAQALRKAFPEVGSQPTAEEMEGRYIEAEPAPEPPAVTHTVQRKSAEPTTIDAATGEVVEGGIGGTGAQPSAKPAAGKVSAGQATYLRKKIAAMELSEETVAKLLSRHGATALDDLTPETFDAVKAELVSMS